MSGKKRKRNRKPFSPEVYQRLYGDKWEQYFSMLVLYRKLNGHCNVNTKRSALGLWCRRQRLRYRQGRLLPEQRERLEELGFEFRPREHRGPGHARLEVLPTEAMLYGHDSVLDG